MSRMPPTIVVLLLGLVPSLRGQSWQADDLKGLDTVDVMIEDLDEDLAEAKILNVSEVVLQTKTELQLRQYGIPVAPAGSLHPTVYVRVNADRRADTEVCYWTVSVEVHEGVRFQRGTLPMSTIVTVWANSSINFQGCDYAGESVIEDVLRLVEMFINDYLSVNPRG